MKKIKLISWNVNGIRAVARKGNLEDAFGLEPDILCLQETKGNEQSIPESIRKRDGYKSWFSSAEKKGYSGVAVYSGQEPLAVREGLGLKRYDIEGRVLEIEYPWFNLFNVYFPNGKASPGRLEYKMGFYDAFLKKMKRYLADGKHIVICGDVNTAHRPIDLARPEANEQTSGFLPEERAWIDALLEAGFDDALRCFHPGPDLYSWWDYKTRARERNVGWRIDYFFIDKGLRKRLDSAEIHSDVMGSDHCPISIELSFPK